LNINWTWFGWVAMITVYIVLSFYCVIAGWTIDYTVTSVAGLLNDLDGAGAKTFYEELLASPTRMMIGQGVFVIATTWIVARGVTKGLEQTVKWMMSLLFTILLALVVYAMVAGEFRRGVEFLFRPDFSKITPAVALAAFGQAFFSLGIGVGVMLTYGAYMPKKSRLFSSAVVIAFSDGAASMLAGLAIFPIVFQYNLSPAEGPGLIFMTLPVAFGQMPGSGYIGALFFLLLVFAALTSSISLLESIISHLEEVWPGGRKKITIWAGVLLWVIGLLTVGSFNVLADVRPLAMFSMFKDRTFFGIMDFLASNIIMPVCGILMAVIAGWLLPSSVTRSELDIDNPYLFAAWQWLVRLAAPVILVMIMVSQMGV
ncbi:MAG: sodium-dependent transporter, partial [Bacteroidota bacterium]